MSNATLVKKKKKSAWGATTRGDRVFLTFIYVLIGIICFCMVYPMYLTIIASISDPYDVFNGKTHLLPSGLTFESYKLILNTKSIWRGYGNTIFYTVVGTLFNLFLTIPAAYAMSKKRMYGRGFFSTLFIITMYFGGGMVPTYLLFKNLGLINTRTILCINGGLSVYNMIVTRTYFQNNIPETLFEAARIDGANEFLTFFKLVLPLSAPILAVITLYYAVGHWGMYFSAMIYTYSDSLQPLQLVLRNILIMNETMFQEIMDSGDPSLLADAARLSYLALTMKYALVFISSAPMLIAYPFVQKYFVKGVMVGSLKG
ncbi:MAG: carbohydrate ABC transporter permease [Oscillospiraceae bacterium]|nr:carbohydrate ABC transporter permease [Oscillospiraceae bacterium]